MIVLRVRKYPGCIDFIIPCIVMLPLFNICLRRKLFFTRLCYKASKLSILLKTGKKCDGIKSRFVFPPRRFARSLLKEKKYPDENSPEKQKPKNPKIIFFSNRGPLSLNWLFWGVVILEVGLNFEDSFYLPSFFVETQQQTKVSSRAVSKDVSKEERTRIWLFWRNVKGWAL